MKSRTGQQFIFGEWKNIGEFTEEDALHVCRIASERIEAMAHYPLAKIYDLFDRLSEKWGDPTYPLRVQMQKELPELTGFSPEMIRLGLDEMRFLFDSRVLAKKVETEFRGIPRGFNFQYESNTRRILRWHPLGSVFHVLSGNVFLVGPGSFIEGVLTGNVTILKQSSAETIFMPAFVESLLESEKELGTDRVVSRSLAVIDYSSSQKKVIETFKNNVDGIVIWGGESAVQAYRNDVPARTRVVVFGPKLSVAVVLKETLNPERLQECAKKLALELCIWDQNACTAPQVCFVESQDWASRLAAAVAAQLQNLETEFPRGSLDPNQAAEIRKWRSIAEITEAQNEGALYSSKKNLDWTVILESPAAHIEPSPLHRTLKMIPFEKLEDVSRQIKDMRSYIQTVGLFGDTTQFSELSQRLGQMGVLRVMPLGKMGGEDIDDPHDGAYDLPQLMNLVVTKMELKNDHIRPFEFLHRSNADRIVDENFLMCIRSARKNPFYQKILKDKTFHNISDLTKIPITEKKDFVENILPGSVSMDWQGGYVTRSGGTTGHPKFSYFNLVDWNHMVQNAAEIFRSCGFDSNDRIANFLFAGDLYGSFISFNDVNRTIGMTSFPFAGVIDEDAVEKIYRFFAFNVVQGFPAVILPLLRSMKKRMPEFKIEKVMYAGQPMSENDRTWLKENLGVKIVASVIGTTEAGQLGYQASHDEGLVHTLIDDYNYVEIVDSNGDPVPFGEEGDILVTSFFKQACPVLRFRIGDRGRFVESKGSELEGRLARRMEYLGRSDNTVIVGAMKANYREFEDCLKKYNVSLVQLVVDNRGEKDHLHVNIETENLDPRLKDVIFKDLSENIYELHQYYNEGLLSFDISIFKTGTLKRTSRTGKVKAIIDRRFDT